MIKPPHYCWEWDGLFIRSGDPEMDACICNFTWRFKVKHVLNNILNRFISCRMKRGKRCPKCGVYHAMYGVPRPACVPIPPMPKPPR